MYLRGKKERLVPAEGRADSRYLPWGGVWGTKSFLNELQVQKSDNKKKVKKCKQLLSGNDAVIIIATELSPKQSEWVAQFITAASDSDPSRQFQMSDFSCYSEELGEED